MIRFGDFRFDERSGELQSVAGDRPPVRLSPQPARLLSHLIEKRPRLVSHEEIRQLLWPDVEVEFEQGLHTAVRQIRSALQDSATTPRYIQTVPRRGYRFLGTIHEEALPPAPARNAPRRFMRVIASAAAVAVLGWVVASFLLEARPTPPPVRVAVMPFEPIGEPGVLARGNDIAESLVESLTRGHPKTLAIVGPTTTAAYDGRPQRVREMIAELDIDYVINARETIGDQGGRLLVEIIRDDGAHVWVRYLDEFPADVGPAETIEDAAVQVVLSREAR